MSNENKTALTAVEILDKTSVELYNSEFDEIVEAMQEFASLQTQDKDKEIAELKANVKHYQETNKLYKKGAMDISLHHSELASQIESQQKEIEELKRAIEDEKKICLRVMDYNSELESQLSEVTKERDEAVRNAFNESRLLHEFVGMKHDTFEDYLKSLTTTKE